MTDLPASRRAGHAEGAPQTRRPLFRLGAMLILLIAVAVVAVLLRPTSEEIRSTVERAGPSGPLLFVLVYALSTFAPFPKAFLSIAAGLLYGLVAGVVLVHVGAMLGAVGAFGLGRRLGREAVERFMGPRVVKIDALLRDRGLLAVISLRLVPVAPFTVVNFAAGLSAVRTRDYVLGTALGILPGAVTYVAIGAYGWNAVSSPAYLAALAVGALGVVAVLVLRRRRRSAAGPARPDPAVVPAPDPGA